MYDGKCDENFTKREREREKTNSPLAFSPLDLEQKHDHCQLRLIAYDDAVIDHHGTPYYALAVIIIRLPFISPPRLSLS